MLDAFHFVTAMPHIFTHDASLCMGGVILLKIVKHSDRASLSPVVRFSHIAIRSTLRHISNDLRCGRIKADHVHHTGIIRISN